MEEILITLKVNGNKMMEETVWETKVRNMSEKRNPYSAECPNRQLWSEGFRRGYMEAQIVLPTPEEASVIAVKVADNVTPKLFAKELAFFTAGFAECAKFIRKQNKL